MELEKAISHRHTHLVLSSSLFLPPIIFSLFLHNHCTGYNRTETFHTLNITFLKIDFLEIAQLMIPREWDGGGCIQRVQPGMIKLFRRIAPPQRNNIYPKITPAPIGSPVLLDPKMCGRSLTFHKCGNIDIDTDLLMVGFASGLSYISVTIWDLYLSWFSCLLKDLQREDWKYDMYVLCVLHIGEWWTKTSGTTQVSLSDTEYRNIFFLLSFLEEKDIKGTKTFTLGASIFISQCLMSQDWEGEVENGRWEGGRWEDGRVALYCIASSGQRWSRDGWLLSCCPLFSSAYIYFTQW